ncbi:MAG TPA: hypothetical protein VFQ39_06035 [Longimicrobium sp.]|nr:hypothetical protein [Longimicrobium sp.]
MKKLKLEMDALRVESFDTRAEDGGGGTVRGLASYPEACDPPSDSQDPAIGTCGWNTCAGDTCWYSCGGSCNCGTGNCGSGGCQPWTAGYTWCPQYPSCIEQCDPPTG